MDNYYLGLMLVGLAVYLWLAATIIEKNKW